MGKKSHVPAYNLTAGAFLNQKIRLKSIQSKRKFHESICVSSAKILCILKNNQKGDSCLFLHIYHVLSKFGVMGTR